jgi:hypothetical protein
VACRGRCSCLSVSDAVLVTSDGEHYVPGDLPRGCSPTRSWTLPLGYDAGRRGLSPIVAHRIVNAIRSRTRLRRISRSDVRSSQAQPRAEPVDRAGNVRCSLRQGWRTAPFRSMWAVCIVALVNAIASVQPAAMCSTASIPGRGRLAVKPAAPTEYRSSADRRRD